jgi:2-methylcitrate dehydratase PrpD
LILCGEQSKHYSLTLVPGLGGAFDGMASATDNLSSYLAEQVLAIRNAELSDADRLLVRQHLLDAVASAFIGSRNKLFEDLAECSNAGSKTQASRSPQDGAMLWAVAINGSVYEDGSREGACHPAAAVIPAVIAFGEGASWETIEKAIIAGYDVMVRVARCGNPQFTRKGFHPTAIAAPFATATVVSQLAGYDLNKTQNALCLAAMVCSGLMASFKQGTTQPLQVGLGARSGAAAALLAGRGNLGYPRIFEEGFFPAYLGSDASSAAHEPLASGWAIKGSYLKPYPGCRHMHATLDAFGQLAAMHRVTAEQIDRIEVGTYKVALDTEIHTLNNRGDAYFNIPYAIAARCVLGSNDYDSFGEEHFANHSIRDVMSKVSLLVDSEMEKRYPKQRGSTVKVRLADGTILTNAVECALGEPENPLSVEVTKQKLRQCAKGLARETTENLERILDIGDHRPTIHDLANAILQNRAFV